LDINNRLSSRELGLETGILAPQAGKFIGEGFGDGFGSALLGGEGLQLTASSEPAPGGELGRVQAFATEQGADLTGLSTGVSFLENTQLLSSAELTTTSFRHNLRICTWNGAGRKTT
jgi:hypothetical protein